MLQFIVLGLVPGTNFQISFYFLVDVVLICLATLLVLRDLRWLVRLYAEKLQAVEWRLARRTTRQLE